MQGTELRYRHEPIHSTPGSDEQTREKSDAGKSVLITVFKIIKIKASQVLLQKMSTPDMRFVLDASKGKHPVWCYNL